MWPLLKGPLDFDQLFYICFTELEELHCTCSGISVSCLGSAQIVASFWRWAMISKRLSEDCPLPSTYTYHEKLHGRRVWIPPAPLQGRQQLHVTRSVGFTLFVVSCLTSDALVLKTNPHLWLSSAAETQSAPIKHPMLFSPLDVCFFSTCNFRLLAVRTKQVLSSAKPGAGKTKRTFSWSELNSSLGSTEHPQVNPSSSDPPIPPTPLLVLHPSTDVNPSLKT